MTTPSWLRRLAGGAGNLLGLALLLVVAIALLSGGRTPPFAGATSTPSPTTAVGAVAMAAPTEATTPSPDPTETAAASTSEPSLEPTAEPTPVPTAKAGSTPVAKAKSAPDPTAEPAKKPDPDPTAKPTKKPKPDPRPESTSRIVSKHGSFGETITIDGIKVRMTPREAYGDTVRCNGSSGYRKHTEPISFDLTMIWPDPDDASPPWVAVGPKPFNVNWFFPEPFRSGDMIFTTCVRPGDPVHVMVEHSPAGDPALLRWYFD